MPRGKASSFTHWVGNQWKQWNGAASPPSSSPSTPNTTQSQSYESMSLNERLDARFEEMMNEVDALSQHKYGAEEHVEYGWITFIRVILPLVFFVGFGYEDGLFMTGFRYLDWEPFILLMYAIGYGLEGLRVAMVYSMNFSKAEGLDKRYWRQFWVWLIMSVGCGIAQLASALVIQALGGDKALTGNNAVAQGAQQIMLRLPWLIYLAISIRVALCAVADWACSGFLHRKRKTVEQKVAEITTRATNLGTIVQANLNAQSMIDNAKQFQGMIASQNEELKQLRGQQKSVFDVVFQAGMRQVNRITEIPNVPELPEPDE